MQEIREEVRNLPDGLDEAYVQFLRICTFHNRVTKLDILDLVE